MNIKIKRIGLFFALIVAVTGMTVVGLSLAARSGAIEPNSIPFGPGIALAAPSTQVDPAFPSGLAGFGAYLDVGASINLVDILPLFIQPQELGVNHVRGSVQTLGPAPATTLYVETSGLIVAYFGRNQPMSGAAVWSGDHLAPVFESPTGRLDEILASATAAAGGDYESLKSSTGYYNLQFPDANKLTLITKTSGTEESATIFYQLPETFILHQPSMAAFRKNRFVTIDNASVLRAGLPAYANISGQYFTPAPAVHKLVRPLEMGMVMYLMSQE